MAGSLPKFTETQIEEALKAVPEWSLVGEAIQRTYTFRDFLVSMQFVSRVAIEAEAVQHHPDILIRYSRVTLTLATHDAGGITGKDFDLATKADAFAAELPGQTPRPVVEVPVAPKPARTKKK